MSFYRVSFWFSLYTFFYTSLWIREIKSLILILIHSLKYFPQFIASKSFFFDISKVFLNNISTTNREIPPSIPFQKVFFEYTLLLGCFENFLFWMEITFFLLFFLKSQNLLAFDFTLKLYLKKFTFLWREKKLLGISFGRKKLLPSRFQPKICWFFFEFMADFCFSEMCDFTEVFEALLAFIWSYQIA